MNRESCSNLLEGLGLFQENKLEAIYFSTENNCQRKFIRIKNFTQWLTKSLAPK